MNAVTWLAKISIEIFVQGLKIAVVEIEVGGAQLVGRTGSGLAASIGGALAPAVGSIHLRIEVVE